MQQGALQQPELSQHAHVVCLPLEWPVHLHDDTVGGLQSLVVVAIVLISSLGHACMPVPGKATEVTKGPVKQRPHVWQSTFA